MNQNHGRGDGGEAHRLPTPAFSRGEAPRRSGDRRVDDPTAHGPDSEGTVPADAFIHPDDEGDGDRGVAGPGMEKALIPPDAPLVREEAPRVPRRAAV